MSFKNPAALTPLALAALTGAGAAAGSIIATDALKEEQPSVSTSFAAGAGAGVASASHNPERRTAVVLAIAAIVGLAAYNYLRRP